MTRSVFLLSRATNVKFAVMRIIATLIVAGYLLSSVTPLSSAHLTPVCNMACCASKALHTEGDCGHGKTPVHAIKHEGQEEVLCGQQGMAPVEEHSHSHPAHDTQAEDAITVFASEQDQESLPHNAQNLNSISISSLSQPCRSDCTAPVFAYRNPNRPHHLVVTPNADLPAPPSNVQLADVDYSFSRKHSALCRKCAGRAPPVFFS